MPTVREKMQEECFKISGDMMEISEGIVDKVEKEKFSEASKDMANLANRLSLTVQALSGVTVMGEETLSQDWETFQEETIEKQKEYQKQMKDILSQMLGLDLDEDDDV